MKKTAKRIFGLIMSLIVILTTAPLPELKVHAAEDYGVWVGGEEFTSEHLTIYGAKGTATYKPEDGKSSGTIVFDDFETSNFGTWGTSKYLFFIEGDENKDTLDYFTIQGKATFKSEGGAVMGLGSYDTEAIIEIGKDAELKIDTPATAIDAAGCELDVSGKLNINFTRDYGIRDTAVIAESIVIDPDARCDIRMNIKNVTDEKKNTCTGIECERSIENLGTLNLNADGPVDRGLYVYGAEPGAEISLRGATNVIIKGDDSIAIGADDGQECSAIELCGSVYADAGKYAIYTDGGITIGEGYYINLPQGGMLSDDKKTIVYTSGIAKAVQIRKDVPYGIWVGETAVSPANKDNIPGIKGGTAAYDPDTSTLKFKGSVTGIEGVHNGAIIDTVQSLNIEGNAVIANEAADYGIRIADDMTGTVTIGGDIDITAAQSVIYAPLKDVVINGNMGAHITAEYSDKNGIECTSLRIDEDASLEVSITNMAYTAINTSFLYIDGGSLNTDGKASLAGVYVNGNMTVAGGSLIAAYDTLTAAVYVSGKAELTDSTVTINGNSLGAVLLTGGELYADNTKLNVSGDAGKAIQCNGKFELDGGKVVAESTKEDGTAIYAAGSISLNDKISILEPKDGKLSGDGKTIVDKDGNTAAKATLASEKDYNTEDPIWNLFEYGSNSYEIAAQSCGGTIVNTNAKSAKYYDAKLQGNIITVSVKEGADRKKAAKAGNSVLEFDLGEGGTVEYVLPVEYKKPSLKLVTSSVTIRDGVEAEVVTQVLVKNENGVYVPFWMNDAQIKYGDIEAKGDGYGYVRFKTSSSGKGAKLSISFEGWEKPVELKFNVKAVNKDVLTIENENGSICKSAIFNKNMLGLQGFMLKHNGQPAKKDDLIITKGAEMAYVAEQYGHTVLYITPSSEIKPGNYTVEVKLADGSAKTSIKIKVSDKKLDSSTISLKVKSKYDVVTGQCMVVTPVCKEADLDLQDVMIACGKECSKYVDMCGNIIISFSECGLKADDLNIGDMNFDLRFSSGVVARLTLKNVKAKKTTPKVRTAAVNIYEEANGSIKGSVNIISTYKDAAGNTEMLIPGTVTLSDAKGGEFVVNDYDRTEIDIKDLTAKSGSVKVKLTFDGGVTKTVKVRVKKAKSQRK